MERELILLKTKHTNHDVREYYISKDRNEIMEKVTGFNNKSRYYTYSIIEFIESIDDNDIKKSVEEFLN